MTYFKNKKRKISEYFHGGPHTPSYEMIDGIPMIEPTLNNTPVNNFTQASTAQERPAWQSNPMQAPPSTAPTPLNTNTNTNTSTSSFDANVQAQQNELMTQGYELPRYGADGFMGSETQGALDRREVDRSGAADTYGVDPNDITFNPNTQRFEPRLGATNAEGDIWSTDGWTSSDSADETVVVGGTSNTTNENNNQNTNEELSLFQRLGITPTNAMSLVEGMSILKANRQANEANRKIGELSVSTDRATPQTYNPELVDLSKAQKDAKELGVAAVRQSQERGDSIAETRTLMTGTADSIRDIAKTESELQKQENNTAKKINLEERRNVEQFNITNARKDQIANNDIKADMYNNSIAITQNMRDTIMTKIKDVKLLGSVEAQIDALSGAIAGLTGLKERKFDDIADSLLSYGADQNSINALKKAYKALNAETEETEESENNVETNADGGFWARRKMMRQNRQ